MARRRRILTRQDVRVLAQRVPRELKELRGKMMLEPLYEHLGVDEVACPACGGTGWLDCRALEHCPLCCGFREVPDHLADWFKARLLSLMEQRRLLPSRTRLERLALRVRRREEALSGA